MVLNMGMIEGAALLSFAFEREETERLFQRWIQGAQNVVSFDEFRESLRYHPPKKTEVIMEDVSAIIDSMVMNNGNI